MRHDSQCLQKEDTFPAGTLFPSLPSISSCFTSPMFCCLIRLLSLPFVSSCFPSLISYCLIRDPGPHLLLVLLSPCTGSPVTSSASRYANLTECLEEKRSSFAAPMVGWQEELSKYQPRFTHLMSSHTYLVGFSIRIPCRSNENDKYAESRGRARTETVHFNEGIAEGTCVPDWDKYRFPPPPS